MTKDADNLSKLDAYLRIAVAERRPDSLRVMIRLGEKIGAGERVRAVLQERNRGVDQVLQGGESWSPPSPQETSSTWWRAPT